MKRYQYDDWLNGNVVLEYDVFIKNGIKKTTVVKWENFNESDILRIKETQKEIFQEQQKELLEKFKKVFLERYEASLDQEVYLDSEVNQCIDIMYGNIPFSAFVTFNHWEIVIEYNDLMDIQQYINRNIVKGLELEYNFIHSPNCKYNNVNKIPYQVYAHVVWNYFKWIENKFPLLPQSELKEGIIPQSKFIVNEYALAFIFDLYANGGQIPKNSVEGGYNAKQLKKIGIEKYDLVGDTFYRSVKKVANYDLNKVQDLNNISKRWLEALKKLSCDWDCVSKYLKGKGLLED
jgi:hypothetical protein